MSRENVPTDRTGLRISVVICTHNPHRGRLVRTLDSLRAQSLAMTEWELMIVDNGGSTPPVAEWVDLAWHVNGRVVEEAALGLTPARLRGYREARSPVIVFVDDDNVLAPDYLAQALGKMEADPGLGATGGPSLPEFEVPPPPWINQMLGLLACRDLGSQTLTASWQGTPPAQRQYPACSPIGAGMVVRREALASYAGQVEGDERRRMLDRRGKSLASGGDNDLVMTVLDSGWRVSYEPALSLQHLIPAGRLDAGYLERLNLAASRTWLLALAVHGIRPHRPVPPILCPLLKAKYYFTHRAWSGPLARIRWKGYCGQAEARSMLHGESGSPAAP